MTKVTFGAMHTAFLNEKARTGLHWGACQRIIEIPRYVSTFCSFYFCQICTAEPLFKLLTLGRKSSSNLNPHDNEGTKRLKGDVMEARGGYVLVIVGHSNFLSSLWCARLEDWHCDATTSTVLPGNLMLRVTLYVSKHSDIYLISGYCLFSRWHFFLKQGHEYKLLEWSFVLVSGFT